MSVARGGQGALVVLLAAQVAVAAAAILARYGLAGGLGPVPLSAWRLTLAALIVLAARLPGLARRGTDGEVSIEFRERLCLLVAGVVLGLHFVTWFASLQYVSVARSTLLVTTGPIWTGLAESVLPARRPPAVFWLGLVIALPGAFLVTAGDAAMPAAAPGTPWVGDLLAVLGAMCMAAYLLLVDGPQARIGTGRTVAWTYTVAAVALWPAVLIAAPTLHSAVPHTTMAWLAVGLMALIPQLLGHTLMNLSLRRFPASAVAAATLLEPVFAGALAWGMLGEPVTARQALGAAILLGGVALSLRRPSANGGGDTQPDMV